MPTPQPCFVFRYNHFDPIWRRCWDRDFVDEGRRFVSYRAIETHWFDDILSTMDDGEGCFMVEASWVLRNYLERYPHHAEALRAYAQAGRLELLGSGENIIDVNMVHGELMARNLLLGTLWGEQVLGVRPTTGWHGDGFGSSAQMPQVFRDCGYDWIPAISYSHPDKPFWRGLDGSAVLFTVPGRYKEASGTASFCFIKHAPCAECAGMGCEACEGRGYAPNRAELDKPPTADPQYAALVAGLWGEEILPGLHVTEAIAALNAARTDVTYKHGTYRDLRPFIADALALVDNPPADQISSRVENNPTQCGCWVSRIKCKQAHRAAEHRLLAAETWNAILGGSAAGDLRDAWKEMTLSAFHDAITSTHVDPAYDELHDMLHCIRANAASALHAACDAQLTPRDGAVTVFNHHGFAATAPVTAVVPGCWDGATVTAGDAALPVYDTIHDGAHTRVTFAAPAVPALGAVTVTLAAAPARRETLSGTTVSHAGFTVEASEHGITRIDADGLGTVMRGDTFLFGEMVLETDEGDPWGTRSLERRRERFSPHTQLAGITRDGDRVVIRYTGSHPANYSPFNYDAKLTYMTWEQQFVLRAGIPWLEVQTSVDWYTQDRRLRLAFPSATAENRGVYEIPYGVLERDRYEATSTLFASGNGDWPAIHWAGIQAPDHTFAIFNDGTPSYRVEDGTVLVSVLRSPTVPCCLLEPASYVAHNYAGMMDHGTHTFRHALYPGQGDWRANDVVRQAALFNSGLSVRPGALTATLPAWGLDAAHTQLATIKVAEDGDGVVVRLVESAGQPETVKLRVPAGTAYAANLLEDTGAPLPKDSDAFVVEMAPWKIVTVRVK
jgi:alpha-mannosidase